MSRQRTDGEDAFLHRHPAQLGQLANIDNEFGRYQTQIHRRQKALAARQHPGLFAMCGQQFQRVCNQAELITIERGGKQQPFEESLL